MSEKGSDDQMTPEQREALERQVELQEAETLEEERKTAAQPDSGDG